MKNEWEITVGAFDVRHIFHKPCHKVSEVFNDKPDKFPNGYRKTLGGRAYEGVCDTCGANAPTEVINEHSFTAQRNQRKQSK